MNDETKRVFFGIEVHAPWPSKLPQGRLLDESHRHLTLAFLGNISYSPLRALLESLPKPPFLIGPVGQFDAFLLFPPRRPNVVAWHAVWLDQDTPLIAFQKRLVDWLRQINYSVDEREWLPHVTLCRQPFNPRAWEKIFVPLPFYAGSIHLYESIGNLNYIPLWSWLIQPPFEEIEHTADMAFIVRGENLQQLFHNAFTALAFKFPPFLNFFTSVERLETLDDVIIALNVIVGTVDGAVGCPLKAVSFHGEIGVLEDSTLIWEMIVDV